MKKKLQRPLVIQGEYIQKTNIEKRGSSSSHDNFDSHEFLSPFKETTDQKLHSLETRKQSSPGKRKLNLSDQSPLLRT